MVVTYLQAISLGFPDVKCHASGDGSVYSSIVWDSGDPIPTQATLDAWISANPNFNNGTVITVLAFRNRFTQTEKVTIDLASIDDPTTGNISSSQQRQLAAALRVMAQDLNVATFVDLSRTDTIVGVHTMETYGLLGPNRANVILTTAVTTSEMPVSLI